MVWAIFLGAICIVTYFIAPLEFANTIIGDIMLVISGIGYIITMSVAVYKENKLNDRVEALENRLNNKKENENNITK